MPLIKASETFDFSSMPVSTDQLEVSAASIVEKARNDANQIIHTALADVHLEVAAIREKARLAGFEAGHSQGFEKGLVEGRAKARESMESELGELRQAWSAMLDDWSDIEHERRKEMSIQVMRLSLAFAEQIVHRTIQHDPDVVIDQIRSALDLAQVPSDLEIVVSEEDRARAHHALPGLLEKFEATGYVSIRSSNEMSQGGCILRMRGGEIDASLEVQLERLVEAMLPERAAQNTENKQFGDEAA